MENLELYDVENELLYKLFQDTMLEEGVDKLYVTVQNPNIQHNLPYSPTELSHGSYYLLDELLDYPPIFGTIVYQDMNFNEFRDNIALTPIYDTEEPLDMYVIKPNLAVDCEEMYATRWGDYHELLEYSGDSYLSSENLDEALCVCSHYTNTSERYFEQLAIMSYLKTPRFNNERCDLVILKQLDKESTLKLCEIK